MFSTNFAHWYYTCTCTYNVHNLMYLVPAHCSIVFLVFYKLCIHGPCACALCNVYIINLPLEYNGFACMVSVRFTMGLLVWYWYVSQWVCLHGIGTFNNGFACMVSERFTIGLLAASISAALCNAYLYTIQYRFAY